ncbi:hypothetical protein [Nocardia crassostreae]|uniref:hypothetical protein n=1 Tax=Nocardia crassostreae TaxID=53428 RepID=UPI00082962BB|nr:hypothetical protein [Nocardia crassostreae]
MGLALATHTLAYVLQNGDYPDEVDELRDQLRAINDLLLVEGLSPHHEPTTRGPATSRDTVGSVPYSFVHYLRRAYARACEYPDQPLTPVADGEDPSEDDAVESVSSMFESHLLCHSDCEGFYVPVDFDVVLYPEPDIDIPGDMLGSSQGLLRELEYVAPYLGITLVDDELPDDEIARISAELNAVDEHPFFRELHTWLLFYETARVSIANNTIITFS